MDSKLPAFSASISTLVSSATGIANHIGGCSHCLLKFLGLLLRELDTFEQLDYLLAACPGFAPNSRNRLPVTFHFRCLSTLDDTIQHSFAVIGKFGCCHFHNLKIPIL